jgi:hypothetical protein
VDVDKEEVVVLAVVVVVVVVFVVENVCFAMDEVSLVEIPAEVFLLS